MKKKRVQNDGRRGVPDPKSDQPHLDIPPAKHLRDSQLRRPPGLKVRRDQRVWWPSAELLLRRTVSYVFNVNSHVASVTFKRSRFESCSHGSRAALKGTLPYQLLPEGIYTTTERQQVGAWHFWDFECFE